MVEGQLPDGVVQFQDSGGVWTVVEGADEVGADSEHPLVQVCIDATKKSMPRKAT